MGSYICIYCNSMYRQMIMIICVNVLIHQKIISLSSMISGKSQGLKWKVKDNLKPFWTRFLSNPKRLRPTVCEVCTVNSITGGVLTWSVGILQTLRCTLQFVGRVGRLAWDTATTSRQISQHVSKECQLVASDITHQTHQTHRAPSHTAPAKSEDGSLQHHRCLAQSRGTKGYRTWNERLNGGFQSDDSHGGISNFHPF